MKDNVLIIGSGGREHALGWKISQSEDVSVVYVAPGNAGTNEGKCRNVPVDFGKKENFHALGRFVDEENIRMTVIGPEGPLYNGVVDFLNSQGYNRVFGPTKSQTDLEDDKLFSFRFMRDAGTPQADGRECHSVKDMRDAIRELGTENGIVFKAGGLTGGKGVTVHDLIEDSINDAERFFRTYGDCKEGGKGVLVSKREFGEEVSAFALCDGKKALTLELAVQDHKAQFDGDKGPNTGGMGAYCPAPIATPQVLRYVAEKIMNPVVERMGYKGFLYAGMIMTKDGPKVLEFNCRMGDPETQPAMMILKSNLHHGISSSLDSKLDGVKLEFNPGAACCVCLTSQGYPGPISTGLEISGLDLAGSMPGVKVFHAGTTLKPYSQMIGNFESHGNKIVTSGGRVLGVTAYSENGLKDSIALAYAACEKISIPCDFFYRRDIGAKGLR